MQLIHFEWSIDRDGYDLRKRKPKTKPKPAGQQGAQLLDGGYDLDSRKPKPAGRRGSTLLTGKPTVDRIVRRGGPLLKTSPLEKRPWRILADTKPTPKGALGFVQEFGFLHGRNVEEEPVFMIIRHRGRFGGPVAG